MGKEYRRQQFIKGMTPAYGGLLCYDNFEGALTWELSGDSAGNRLYLSDYRPSRGGGCMEIYNDLETPVDAETIGAKRYFMLSDAELLRFICMFRIEEKAVIQYLHFQYLWQTKTLSSTPLIRFDLVNDKLLYWDGDLGWTDVPGGTFKVLEGGWLYFDMLCNIKQSEYISINLNGGIVDMSGLPIENTAGTYFPNGTVDISATQEGTGNRAKMWVDELVILSE